jgi:hypothetical protein
MAAAGRGRNRHFRETLERRQLRRGWLLLEKSGPGSICGVGSRRSNNSGSGHDRREGGRRDGGRRLEECNRTSVVVLRPGIRGEEIARLIVLALTGLGCLGNTRSIDTVHARESSKCTLLARILSSARLNTSAIGFSCYKPCFLGGVPLVPETLCQGPEGRDTSIRGVEVTMEGKQRKDSIFHVPGALRLGPSPEHKAERAEIRWVHIPKKTLEVRK